MNSLPLCLTLTAVGGNGNVGRHLPVIKETIGAREQGRISIDIDSKTGACRITLPSHYCMVRAQALGQKLNSITDESGRPVLESKIEEVPFRPRGGMEILAP